MAYPTYDVGARLAGATPVAVDALTALGPLTTATTPKLLWLNTPGNPTGKVLGVEHLAKVVSWARQHGVVVASDECYAELAWRRAVGRASGVPTLPRPAGHRRHRTRACSRVYSLSKQSNLAGYRAAFVAGDPALVGRLLEVRKHAGMIVPWPVQRAVLAALGDDEHVAAQKARYAARRAALLPGGRGVGLRGRRTPRPGSTCGRPRGRGLLGDGRAAGRAAASSWRRATSTGPPGERTCASR